MRRPSRIGRDDRAEIVVEQHDRRRLARDVGPATAHRDADVRRLQRGGIVDAVAGHGDDLAVGLQRLDDAQLLLGHDAREDGDGAARAAPARRRSSASSSCARDNVSCRRARPGARWPGGRRIVAGDHHHPDAGGAAFGAPPSGTTRPQRIGKADEAEELERESRAASPASACPAKERARHPSTRRPSAAIASTAAASAPRDPSASRRQGRRWLRARPWPR